MKSRFTVVSAAVALMSLLSGCGGALSGSASEESREESCSGLTAQEAVDEWIVEVPPIEDDITSADDLRNWNTELDDSIDSYDECAALSWIEIGIIGATGSSPKHVMLFHHGEFVMTATVEPESFIPSVEQVTDAEVGITFGYLKPGEGTANASGKAVSTYAWDEDEGTVVRSGELPDGSDSEARVVDGDESDEAGSCAGGFALPDGVDESVCGEPADGAQKLTPGQYGSALIFTPTKNVWCSFTEDELDCAMTDPKVRIGLGTSGEAYTPNRDDGPVAEEPTTVEYGESVTFGPFVCVSQEIGLSCWNTESGHGLFLSRDSHQMW